MKRPLSMVSCLSLLVSIGVFYSSAEDPRPHPQVPQRSLSDFYPTNAPVELIEFVKTPEDAMVRLKGKATFEVKVKSSKLAEPGFQWRLNGMPLTDGGRFEIKSDHYQSKLIIKKVRPKDLGVYDCVVTTQIEEVVSPSGVLSSYTLDCDDLPPELQGKCEELQTRMTGPMMIAIGRTVVTPPFSSLTNCPYPFISRMRIPDGLGVVKNASTSGWLAYDLTDNLTKITYHGNAYENGCGTNRSFNIDLNGKSSTRFFFVVHFPEVAMIPAQGELYYLYLEGFAPYP